MNIEIAGVNITFGTVSELHDTLKRKCAALDKEIAEHETRSSNMRKVRKEMLKILGGQPDAAKPAVRGASGA
jgi:hypothetical protein